MANRVQQVEQGERERPLGPESVGVRRPATGIDKARELFDECGDMFAITVPCRSSTAEEVAHRVRDLMALGLSRDAANDAANDAEVLRQKLRSREAEIKELDAELQQLRDHHTEQQEVRALMADVRNLLTSLQNGSALKSKKTKKGAASK